MKLNFKYILFSIILLCSVNTIQGKDNPKVVPMFYDKFQENNSNVTHLEGYLGQKIDLCINQRIKKQDVQELVNQFKTRTIRKWWITEFWGKWMLSAVDAYSYTHDAEILKMLQEAVTGLLATQTADGYIGSYSPEGQLTGWDVWGRKYTLLGLLAYYDISGDKKALTASIKLADHLLSQLGVDKTNIVKTGSFRGMPSSSVLKPMVQLYRITGEKRYLDFAKYIVAQWETEDGPKLISKALDSVAVSNRFPQPKNWWSWDNGQKAYEMMSCYDGLLDLYKLTGEPKYLKSVEMAVKDIINNEINVAGSGSAFECFYHGAQRQTDPTYHTMETCVTFTWMQLCNDLLRFTSNPKYADQLEISTYNALMASLKFDGSQITKYCPLEGSRKEGERQCSTMVNCCNMNGPRAFVMLPKTTVTTSKNEIFVNLYCQSTSVLQLNPKNKTTIQQLTSYPETDKVELIVQPDKTENFSINLRIPAWSKNSTVSVNGVNVENVKSGEYLKINREWKKDDKITLKLDMSGRLITLNGYQAIMRGPVLLARDSRFEDGFVDEAAVIQNKDNFVELVQSDKKPEHVWMAFTAPMVLGTDLEGEFKNAKQIHFCDFASAGNTWDYATRYRVWIKQTLNVINSPYIPY